MNENFLACTKSNVCYNFQLFLTLALNILILSIFYISMDLSTNHFAHFSECWASFACSCHYPRMLCHVFWSQVEYKIVYFIYLRMTATGRSYVQNFLKVEYVIAYAADPTC